MSSTTTTPDALVGGSDHHTAPTQAVEADGIRSAYRRYGQPVGTARIFFQHVRGGLEHWDPLVTDGLSAGREIILFDHAGVAGSSAQIPDTIEAMADHAAAFIGALGLSSVDVLGFSIGGCAAQAVTSRHRNLVRRQVLVRTGPRGGDREGAHPDVPRVAGNPAPTLEDFLCLFFGESDASHEPGERFYARRTARTVDVDPPSSPRQRVRMRRRSPTGSCRAASATSTSMHVSQLLDADPAFS